MGADRRADAKGANAIDHTTKAKNLYDAYPFDRPMGIHHFLMHRDKLTESCYLHGGVDVLIMLIDFAALEAAAPLTEKQRMVLDLYYRQGYTQCETAEILGVSHQTVCEHIKCALQKIVNHHITTTGGDAY